jgi:hypothetical protein
LVLPIPGWALAPLAQLAEHFTCNEDVIGSIPIGGSMMKLWLIERIDGMCGYDEYDSFVVAASSPVKAFNVIAKTHPNRAYSTWPVNFNQVKITEIGIAASKKQTIILGSFNAG